MARIIYYNNLDYDLLPTAKKQRSNLASAPYREPDLAFTVQEPLRKEPDIIIDSDSDDYNPTRAIGRATNQNRYHGSDQNGNGNGYSSMGSSYASSSDNAPPRSQSPAQATNLAPRNNFGTSFVPAGSVTDAAGARPLRYRTDCNKESNSNFRERVAPLREQHLRPNRPIVTYSQADERLLTDTLKRYFGFDKFRGKQLNAVMATCRGKDTLILMPTGGGKSICYQLPAIISPGISIVVSPLKSLIADQVQRLRCLNIKTSALYGETSDQEAESILLDLRQDTPSHKLLYVTPEKINASTSLMNIFRQLYDRNLLSRFVIDEAHCVSMWGSDFRPDYRKLGKLRDLFPDVPIMALTATAPPKVRDDILDQLKMTQAGSEIFIQSFNRPNLKFEVRTKNKGCLESLGSLIRANFTKQCGIVYCLSRKDCQQVAEKLRDDGIRGAPYHAGLSDEQRKRVFDAWSSGKFQVVCATIAFGMGIDKSDVRFVIHYSTPKSIEGYYQEAGRAGRDSQFASCILFYSKSDIYRMKSMLSRTGFGRKAEDKNREIGNLQHIIDYAENKSECRRSILLKYLGEKFDTNECIRHPKTACDNCLAKLC